MGAVGLNLRSNGVRYDQDGADAEGSCIKVRRLDVASLIVFYYLHCGCPWKSVDDGLGRQSMCARPTLPSVPVLNENNGTVSVSSVIPDGWNG